MMNPWSRLTSDTKHRLRHVAVYWQDGNSLALIHSWCNSSGMSEHTVDGTTYGFSPAKKQQTQTVYLDVMSCAESLGPQPDDYIPYSTPQSLQSFYCSLFILRGHHSPLNFNWKMRTSKLHYRCRAFITDWNTTWFENILTLQVWEETLQYSFHYLRIWKCFHSEVETRS